MNETRTTPDEQICTSHFKNEKNEPAKEEYTQIWARLIMQMENGK